MLLVSFAPFWSSLSPLSRCCRFPPSLCSATSVWRAERSPWTPRSPAWWKRASTTTSCPSESTAAGACWCLVTCCSVCLRSHCHEAAVRFLFHERRLLFYDRKRVKGSGHLWRIERQLGQRSTLFWVPVSATWRHRKLTLSLFLCSWVICEHGNYRGRQFLLEPVEIINWPKFSSIQTIGSMFPVRQVCNRVIFTRRKNQVKFDHLTQWETPILTKLVFHDI